MKVSLTESFDETDDPTLPEDAQNFPVGLHYSDPKSDILCPSRDSVSLLLWSIRVSHVKAIADIIIHSAEDGTCGYA